MTEVAFERARDMLETLQLSDFMPGLARIGFACLVVPLGKLALDAYRCKPTSLRDTVCEWIGFAGAGAIGTVVTEAQSRHLISSGLETFLMVAVLALWVAPRVAPPATAAAAERGEEGADA